MHRVTDLCRSKCGGEYLLNSESYIICDAKCGSLPEIKMGSDQFWQKTILLFLTNLMFVHSNGSDVEVFFENIILCISSLVGSDIFLFWRAR